MISFSRYKFVSFFQSVDILFFLFLCLMMVDAIWIKPMALGMALLWMNINDVKLNIKSVPPFYWIIIGICVVQYVLLRDFSSSYLLFWSIGVFFWLMSIFAFLAISVRVKKQDPTKIINSLKCFFVLNVIVTFYQLSQTMLTSGVLNPYALWDVPEFGNSTGDYLKGIFFGPCYINFMANSFFAIFFLYRKEHFLSFLAIVILCLTSSNFAIVFFLPLYIVVLFLCKVPKAWLSGLAGLGFIVLFYLVISVGNFHYLTESITKTEHNYNKENIGQVDKTVSNDNKVTNPTDADFFKEKKGKLIAVDQTIDFVQKSPINFLFGAGVGNFSSLLAKRQSDIQIEQKSRLFKMLPQRIAESYRSNHYTIERHLYNLPSDWHSIQQQPASFFNQILGEYGVIGTLGFLLFYALFIIKKVRFKAPLMPMALLLGYYLLFDYLFEYLSIIVLFEIFYTIQLMPKGNSDFANNEQ